MYCHVVLVKRLRRTENVRGTFEGVSTPRECGQPSPLPAHRTPHLVAATFRAPEDFSPRALCLCRYAPPATRSVLPLLGGRPCPLRLEGLMPRSFTLPPRCLPSSVRLFFLSLRFSPRKFFGIKINTLQPRLNCSVMCFYFLTLTVPLPYLYASSVGLAV